MHRRQLVTLGAVLSALIAAPAIPAFAQDDPSASPPAPPAASPAASPPAASPAASPPAGSPPAASAIAAGPVIALPNGWQPEGITSNGDTLYVGSLANGAIWLGSASEGTGDVFIEGEDGRVAVGVDYEAANDRLWVAGGDTGEVRVYDATTGEDLGEWEFEESGFLNDLVATPTGVYVTDSMMPELKVIPLGDGGALPPEDGGTTLALGGEYEQVDGFNANGIVASGDQLILVQSATGTLFRVDPTSGEATAIDAGDYTFTNGDGLEIAGSDLFVVRNQLNLVALVTLDEALQTATLVGEVTSPDLDVPTTAAWSGDKLYAVNARFNTEPGPDVEYWITPLNPPAAPASPAPSAS
jgi:sugar lactone lactonase YvrE